MPRLGLLVLTALAVSWLSVALGMVTDSVETASNLPMFLMLLLFLSSAFVPTASMPGPLGWFAEHQPFTPIIETLRALLAGTGDAGSGAGRGGVVPRDRGRRLPVGATPVRAHAGTRGRVGLRAAGHGVGWRARIRTWNPLIQSQVPYR